MDHFRVRLFLMYFDPQSKIEMANSVDSKTTEFESKKGQGFKRSTGDSRKRFKKRALRQNVILCLPEKCRLSLLQMQLLLNSTPTLLIFN